MSTLEQFTPFVPLCSQTPKRPNTIVKVWEKKEPDPNTENFAKKEDFDLNKKPEIFDTDDGFVWKSPLPAISVNEEEPPS